MQPDSADPDARPRAARLRLLTPVALAAGGLAVFLALFWDAGHGRKGHARKTGSAREGSGSPVGGGSASASNTRATGESPIGGGPSRPRGSAKGETWWYREGDSKRAAPKDKDAWWAPRKDRAKSSEKAGAPDESPVGGRSGSESKESRRTAPRGSDGPSDPSQRNPGEAAGQTGPDDFWWRN